MNVAYKIQANSKLSLPATGFFYLPLAEFIFVMARDRILP